MSQHSPSSLQLAEGMIIANRFRLIRLLGQGGMGSVWVAHHLTLDVEVAVKFIDTPQGVSHELSSRFTQEAHAAAKIKSPHVVSIQDHGTDEAGRPYIAMELLQGQELAARLDREGALPLGDVVRIVTQTAKGLARAHSAGFVHRDLKPENIFLCDDDEGFLVKILDFGIAKTDSPVGGLSHRTGTGQLIGTPMFMSPEQALGTGKVDFRSDLYSLAVVAFRCLTGRLPHEATALGELIVAVTTKTPPPPSQFRPDLPAAVDAWFARATSKDREARFGSAKEMADAFAAACGVSMGEQMPASMTAAPVIAATAVSARAGTLVGSASPLDDTAPVPSRGSRPWVLAAVAVAAALVGLAGVMVFARPSPAPAPSPAASPSATAAASASGPSPLSSAPAVVPVEQPAVSASAPVDERIRPADKRAAGDKKASADKKTSGAGGAPAAKPPAQQAPPQKDYGLLGPGSSTKAAWNRAGPRGSCGAQGRRRFWR